MSQFVTDRSYDYFDLGDESDQESAESSEDEIDIILHGTPEQRRRLCQSHAKEQRQKASQTRPPRSKQLEDRQPSSSEDEFEKEMNAELNRTVSMLEKSRGSKPVAGVSMEPSTPSASNTEKMQVSSGGNSTGEGQSKSAPFYSDIYFDSDDEENYEGEGEARVKRHHSRPSNDDLLYDPDMDDEDQRWVDRQRQQHHLAAAAAAGGGGSNSRQQRQPGPAAGQRTGRGGKKRTAAAVTPKSDAVLDCPACMTTLCIDCQRHDIYPNQFRAMFVMNCRINHSELLSVPEQAAKKRVKKAPKKSRKGQEAEEESVEDGGSRAEGGGAAADSAAAAAVSSADQFHPVLCGECDTVVGVVDMEEVYHFFNVLVSQP